jgi:hypothetical protein
MSDTPAPRRSRFRGALIVAVLLVVIVAVVVIGLVTAGAFSPTAAATSSPPTATALPSGTGSATATPTASAKPTKTAKATASAKPTPQPTKTATLASPAPIVKQLTAKVSTMEAVQGKANGPGEIAGPAVRFTITIANDTGKKVSLASTVVNAYFGTDSSPAIELQKPGGKSFPASVASGKTATGVFVFNIPKAQRQHVEVTVDTSVSNPVVAFKGSAPR